MNTVLKVILVCLPFVVISGVACSFLAPLLLPALNSAIPQLGNLTTTLSTHIQNLITYAQKHWQLVLGTGGTITGAGLWLSNKIYKHNIQKKELETTSQLNSLQSQIFQKEGEVLAVKNQLTDAQSKIEGLEADATNVAEIKAQLEARVREVERLTAERNQLANLLPNVKTAQQLIEESKRVE